MELKHYGILGMHWGIRRYQPYPKGKKPAGAKEIGEAAKENDGGSNNGRTTDISKLSDQELRNLVNRLNLEKQYSQLTKEQISSSRKFANKVVSESAKNVATSYLSKAMTAAITGAIALGAKQIRKKMNKSIF